MISTMIPEIWWVLVSRNVKGIPVGVEPTRTTCWALLAPIKPNARAVATTTRQSNLANMARTLLKETACRRICLEASARHRRTVTWQLGDDHRKRASGCQTYGSDDSDVERRRTSGSLHQLRASLRPSALKRHYCFSTTTRPCALRNMW